MNSVRKWVIAPFFCLFLSTGSFCFARLSLDASVGFDGLVIPQSWSPVLVEMFNDGPTVEGFVAVRSAMQGNGVEYCKPIILSTNSRKRVWLYPHAGNYEREFLVRLVAPNGREIDRTTVQMKTVPAESRVFVSATGSEMNLLPSAGNSDNAAPVFVGRMRPEALPDDAAGYEGLSALVLTDVSESQWTIGQRQALRNWVAFGGRLVVSVHNADNFIHFRFWEDLLPMRMTGSEVVANLDGLKEVGRDSGSAPAATETPVAVGAVQRGTVRARAGDKPLVIDAPFGRGRVTLLTFDIERPPFRSWAGREAFWRGLLEAPEPAVPGPDVQPQPGFTGQGWPGGSADDLFRNMFEARLEHQISLWWLLALIGCYLLVIGPFDYWLVRHRLKRPVLTWVTFPAYVVGFSGLIYGIGYALKSGDSELAQVSFVDVVSDAGLSRGMTVAGFYSTSNRRYRFEGTMPESHFRLYSSDFGNTGAGPGLGQNTRVIETDRGYDVTVPVPIWSSKTFVSRWDTSERVFNAAASREGNSVRLRLRNELPVKLTEIHAIYDRSVVAVPDLEPNGSQELVLRTDAREDFSQWLGRKRTSIQQCGMMYPVGAFHPHRNVKDLPAWNLLLEALSFNEALHDDNSNYRYSTWPGLDLSRQATTGNLIVLAYADDFPVSGC